MKIIVLFPQFSPHKFGSMHHYYVSLKNDLYSLGHEVLDGCPLSYLNTLLILSPKNKILKKVMLKLSKSLGGWILESWAFVSLVKASGAKVALLSISQEYCPPILKDRTAVISHDLIQLNYPRSFLALLYYKYYILYVLKKVRLVVTVSESKKIELGRFGIKSIVSYNSFDHVNIITRHLFYPAPSKKVLWIGTRAMHKSLVTLLEAAQNLMDVEFTVVIDDNIEQYSKPLSSNVHFFSGLSELELLTLYRANEIFVSTSLDEGYGRPAMEARISGCKLVLTDIPVYRELHGKVAFFFPVENSLELTKKIGQAFLEPYDSACKIDDLKIAPLHDIALKFLRSFDCDFQYKK